MCKYSEDYKHFDNLIWQVPTWCIAIFTGILVGVNEIIKDTAPSWPIEQNTLLTLIFFSGFIFLFSLSYTLHRFRCHQTHIGAKSPCRINKPGAQFFLQFTVSYQTTVFFALSLYTFVHNVNFTLIAAGFFLLIITLFFEKNISTGKQ